MEILRVPSSTITYVVSGLEPTTEYTYSGIDLADQSTFSGVSISTEDGVVSIALPSTIDGEYEITIDGSTDFVSVVRPYVDPNTLATTATDIAEYTKLERIARAIIESSLNNVDFYNKKSVYEVSGNGLDLMPIWKDVNSVLKVYENNVLVYDATAETNPYIFGVTKDKSAIYKVVTGYANIIEANTPGIPIYPTDYAEPNIRYSTFRKGSDYTFILDVGYKTIPRSIVDATNMLIDDLKCGKLDYFQRYVTSYNTDQFRIQFDKKMLEGTGNILVDKILSKYEKSITRVGVL